MDEVLRCKPRYLDMLFQRRHALDRAAMGHTEFMLAQLTMMVANTGFKGWKEPRTTDEFMPSRRDQPAAPAKPKRKSKADRMRIVESFLRSPFFAVQKG